MLPSTDITHWGFGQTNPLHMTDAELGSSEAEPRSNEGVISFLLAVQSSLALAHPSSGALHSTMGNAAGACAAFPANRGVG